MERGFLLRQDEAGRINALRRYNILDTPPDGIFDRITRLAARLLNVPIAVVSLVDTDRIWFKSRHGLDVAEVARHPGLCSSAILADGPWIVADALHDPRTCSHPLVTGEFGLRFYAGVPLTSRDGYNMGALCVIDRQPREIDDGEIATLKDLAAILMDEMELRQASSDAIEKAAALRQQVTDGCAPVPEGMPAQMQDDKAPRAVGCGASTDAALAERRRCKRPPSASSVNTRSRHLSHALQTLREAERRRIARQLHDGLAQSLAALRMELAMLWQEPGQSVSMHKRFSGFDGLLESTILSLRRIATDLHPTVLGEGGLYFALRSLLRNFSRETGIACELIAEERELVLEEAASTAAFRIVQEALLNVGRHAEASRVIVMLHREGTNLSLKIHDDGCEITEDDPSKENCFGLIDMRERVLHMQGSMDVTGHPGGGSVIAVMIPIVRKKNSRRPESEMHTA